MAQQRNIRYTTHARSRMGRRQVPEEAVEWVMEHHHSRFPARPLANARPSEILVGDFQGRQLRVYVEIDSDPPLVKTVAWTSEGE